MHELYPLKFEPILKEKVWGGNSLVLEYGKKADPSKLIGESWEISAVADHLSVVSNGFLAGNDIEEIIEVYMSDITGEAVYEKFGIEFPLLIKFIEASSDLSVQVHPDDRIAKDKHNAYGKTEMWYILKALPGSKIYTGFKEPLTEEKLREAIYADRLPELLNIEYPQPGDVFFTPAGRVHAIGGGITLVEIQQTSDITYRIFDWNRTGQDGKPRELHVEYAIDAIDYNATGSALIRKEPVPDKTVNLVTCDYFVTNIIHLTGVLRKDYNLIDSFVIYICTEGKFSVHFGSGTETAVKGETLLVPAVITDVILEAQPEAVVLEVFIKSPKINES
ncbi:MAG: type I phosphomannose isomerase catalytic subunit [Bacteroidales bacterium]